MKKKIVIIAGGDGSLGFACVKRFLKSDYKVIVLDRRFKNKNFFLRNNVVYFKTSLKSEKNINSILSKINKKEGRPNLLINCIGIFSSKTILKLDMFEIENILKNNIVYPLILIKNFIKISDPKKITKIINIGSIAGQNGGEFAGDLYSISKAGIINLTKSIAKKFGKRNIICNCINPGPLEGNITKNWPKKIKQNLIKKYKINQKTLGNTSDIAEACLFLADDHSNYIQGTELNINGGLVI